MLPTQEQTKWFYKGMLNAIENFRGRTYEIIDADYDMQKLWDEVNGLGQLLLKEQYRIEKILDYMDELELKYE